MYRTVICDAGAADTITALVIMQPDLRKRAIWITD